MNPSSAHFVHSPSAAQQHQDAHPALYHDLTPRSHTYPLPALHHPTPVRGFSVPAPRLHAPPPSQPTPQVYAALYDHLVARWTVQAQEVAHDHDERAVKRARTLREASEAGAEQKGEDSGKEETSPREARLVEQATDDDSTSRTHRQSSLPPPTLTRPESNLRSAPSFAPHPLRRKRSASSPPVAASQESSLIPRGTSPPPYEPQDHRCSAPTSPRPIAPLPSSHRRRSSSDALVNVIKSFEVVLQYRAQGWRMLDQTMAMERRRSAGMEG